MKHFIVIDNKKLVGETLKEIKTIDEKDKKLTFYKLKFSMNVYEKLRKNESKIFRRVFKTFFI